MRLKALGLSRLEPGQVSATLRFRTTPHTLSLLEDMSPAERGAVLERGLRLRTLYIAVVADKLLIGTSRHELELQNETNEPISKIWVRDL